MAKIRNNIFLKGASGKIGKVLVLRYRLGQLELYARPRKPQGPRSAKQKALSEMFTSASAYAKSARKKTRLYEAYRAAAKRHTSWTARNVAIRDYAKKPEILTTNIGEYRGEAGAVIRIAAKDDFEVVTVKVTIEGPDGYIVESGDAVKEDSLHWVYVTSVTNDCFDRGKLVVDAWDNPGNQTTKTIDLAADSA